MDLQVGLIFAVGAMAGSFLNVCIYRLPRGESVVRPRSHCPKCRKPVPFWLNIPIISFILLRGRCRSCRSAIGFTYPLVELLGGGLLLLVWTSYGLSWTFLHYSILVLLLVPITFIDLDTKLILNVLTLPGIVVGFLAALTLDSISVVDALAGMLVGGGFLWMIGLVGKALFKKESMGGGDIKLGAMIGVFVGPKVLVALSLAFFLAFPVILVGFTLKSLRRDSVLPFGPFISLGAVLVICFEESIYRLYFQLLATS